MGESIRDLGPATSSEPLHEMSDAQIQPLAYFLAGLGAALVVVAAIVWILFTILFATINDEPIERRAAEAPPAALKEPALQVFSRAELETILKRDEQALRAIGWVDREQGLARIPIDAAIEMVARNGLPKWPPAPREPAGANPQQRPTASNEKR